jgi:hypothetical protein
MKLIVLLGACLLALPAPAQAPRPAAAAQTVPASLVTFNALSNDTAALLSRALAEPSDARALALLRGPEAAQLVRRQLRFQPEFAKWRATLSPSQRQAIGQQIINDNPVMVFAKALQEDPAATARLQRNPALKTEIEKMVYGLFADGKKAAPPAK